MALRVTLHEQLEQVRNVVGPGVCLVVGHNRSRGAAFEDDREWYSRCKRCGRPLRREAPRIWREITSEQFETAQLRRRQELQALRYPRQVPKRNRTKRAPRPKQA